MKLIRELSQRFFKSKLIIGSSILIIGTLVGGLGNYFYHLLMGRMLGPNDYGILASLISLSYLLSIPIGTLNLVLIKFVSAFKGKNEKKAIGALFKISNKKILPFSFLLLLIFLALTPLITSFLHLSSSLSFIIVLGVFFVSIFSSINRAFLQGLLRFGYISLSTILEITLKLIVTILFVLYGFKVNGALFGFLIAGFFAYLLTLFPLRFLLKKNQQKLNIDKKEIINFTLPVFFSTLALTSLFTSDVILVRHFFPDQQAGLYAALSTMGKIIYFLVGPIVAVMFPLISERNAHGGNYKNLFLASLGLVGIICFFGTIFYFLFPSLIIKIFFGSQYLSAFPYLGLFGIFLSFYSFAFLFINFYLSIKKTGVAMMSMVAAFLQIIFIWFFHQTLWQVIWISIIVMALLLIGLLIYWFQYPAQKRNLRFTK